MPVKNAAPTLERAVASMRDQTFRDWELILVDDGSTDGSRELMKRFRDSDPRMVCLENPTPGIVSALNQGIARAKGPFIARMDADDESLPERLERQYSHLKDHRQVGLLGTRVEYMGNRSKHQGYANYVDWTNSLTTWKDIRANRFVESPFAHPSVMFRRELCRTCPTGPYRQGSFPEDYELWLRWMDAGIRMEKLEKTLLRWFDGPQRLSRKDARYDPEAFYATKAVYLGKWLKKRRLDQKAIWIWGAGRITRKRAGMLSDEGIRFAGYLEIDPAKAGKHLGGLPVVLPGNWTPRERDFVISYVGNRGAREKIRHLLHQKGLKEEKNYILAA